MSERIERLIYMAFSDWKKDQQEGMGAHPDEEQISCFLEGTLRQEDAARLKEHLAVCDACARLVAADLEVFTGEELEVPAAMLDRARDMVPESQGEDFLDIVGNLSQRPCCAAGISGNSRVKS
jgi:hypothetical protein